MEQARPAASRRACVDGARRAGPVRGHGGRLQPRLPDHPRLRGARRPAVVASAQSSGAGNRCGYSSYAASGGQEQSEERRVGAASMRLTGGQYLDGASTPRGKPPSVRGWSSTCRSCSWTRRTATTPTTRPSSTSWSAAPGGRSVRSEFGRWQSLRLLLVRGQRRAGAIGGAACRRRVDAAHGWPVLRWSKHAPRQAAERAWMELDVPVLFVDTEDGYNPDYPTILDFVERGARRS